MMNPITTFAPDQRQAHLQTTWAWRVAFWCSQIASPPILGVVAVLLTASVLATPKAWLWAFGYLLIAVGLPSAYIVWLVHRGDVADVHVPVRAERIRPLICAVSLALLAWLVLYRVSAPRLLQCLAGVNSLQATLFLAITLRWKVSLHCATAANLAVLALVLVSGAAATPFVMLVPVVAWSRIHLQRHTFAQAAGGALLGTTTVLVGLALFTFAVI